MKDAEWIGLATAVVVLLVVIALLWLAQPSGPSAMPIYTP